MKFLLNSEFKLAVAKQLEFEGIAKIENQTLILDDEAIYQLEERQLAYLDAPDYFIGYLSVKFKSAPRPFHCELIFKDEFKHPIKDFDIDGCVITYQDERYILPKTMFDIYQANQQQRQTHDEDLLWTILENAKNSSDPHLELQGLSKDTFIHSLPPLNIDIEINADGSANIKPFLSTVSEEIQQKYQQQILDSSYLKLIVETATIDGKRHILRHIMHPKDIEAYKRLNQIGVIDKEDVAKFLQNPAPFIYIDDESEEELPIAFDSYRILGMGQPYVGYFGSKLIDSPIAQALISNGDITVVREIKELVASTCNGKSKQHIEEIQRLLETAIVTGAESCQLDSEISIPQSAFATAKEVVKKVIQELDGSRITLNPTKIVISIDPNDEVSVSFQAKNQKSLNEIETNNTEKANIYQNFKSIFEPKSYQVEGVNWLIDLYINQFRGGILADDMGLGKTFQVIAFINYLLKIDKSFENQRVLIVAPTVLLNNWKNEFEKFLTPQAYDNLNIHIVRGRDLAKRKQVNATEQGVFNTFDVNQFLQRPLDILITSYETLSNYQFSFAQKAFNWGCVIYDEAHKIKNPNALISQASRAISSETNFSVLLTGTPIENALRDLWALFDVFDPQHFGSWKKFKEMYVNKDNSNLVEQQLREHASNYLLRRLKKDYLKELPDKIEQVHEVVFNAQETEKYESYLNADEPSLTRLHNLRKFSLVGNQENKGFNQYEFSKITKLMSLLKTIQTEKEKVIIFIIQKSVQNTVQFEIKKNFDIDVPVINGNNNNSENVQSVLNIFEARNGFNVIILSPLAAGVGLTITSANHVIHYERWWNASKEDQASDRAYRIGQKKDVYIHYLLGELSPEKQVTSIDKAIHNLITQKRETAGFLIPPKSITYGDIAVEMGESSNHEMLAQQIEELSWQNFEDLVKKIYERQDYECKLTPLGREDYGADIIARNDDEIIAIQCKHSLNGKDRNDEAIFALINQSITVYHATKLVAVTNSNFNANAKKLAKENNVELIEKEKLLNQIIYFDISLIS